MKREIFLEIKWTRKDIANILRDNDIEPTEQNVDEYLDKLNVRYFEEKCIQYGMEILNNLV